MTDEKAQLEQLRLLSDEPTQQDEIGSFAALATTLVSMIRSATHKPFVLGLFGSWGSGKSSVVEMLIQQKELPFKIVFIDAWKKDKSNFLRQFVKRLSQDLLSEQQSSNITRELDLEYLSKTRNGNQPLELLLRCVFLFSQLSRTQLCL